MSRRVERRTAGPTPRCTPAPARDRDACVLVAVAGCAGSWRGGAPGRHQASKTRRGSQEDAHLTMPDRDHRGAARRRPPPLCSHPLSDLWAFTEGFLAHRIAVTATGHLNPSLVRCRLGTCSSLQTAAPGPANTGNRRLAALQARTRSRAYGLCSARVGHQGCPFPFPSLTLEPDGFEGEKVV